jgi:hypothetical protein
VVVALAVAPAASAGNIADARLNAVASWAAMKPVTVWCENDADTWARMAAAARVRTDAEGYAYVGGSQVFLGPLACQGVASSGSALLGVGLMTLLHEATHARGWADEDLAECAARVLIYSALHKFYGIGWMSPEMSYAVGSAMRWSFGLPAPYQGGCARL